MHWIGPDMSVAQEQTPTDRRDGRSLLTALGVWLLGLTVLTSCDSTAGNGPGLTIRDSAGVAIVEHSTEALAGSPRWTLSRSPIVEIGGGDALLRLLPGVVGLQATPYNYRLLAVLPMADGDSGCRPRCLGVSRSDSQLAAPASVMPRVTRRR